MKAGLKKGGPQRELRLTAWASAPGSGFRFLDEQGHLLANPVNYRMTGQDAGGNEEDTGPHPPRDLQHNWQSVYDSKYSCFTPIMM